jgi:hypothetical protein
MIKATISSYHDFIVMNHKETVFDPTPEDVDRIMQEGDVSDLPEVEQHAALEAFMKKLSGREI